MEELEVTVQKHVVNFCKILPTHVEKWRMILQDAVKPAEALSNYAEQLRHVERGMLEDELRIVLLGLRTMIKEDLKGSCAELVFGQPIRLTGVCLTESHDNFNVEATIKNLQYYFENVKPTKLQTDKNSLSKIKRNPSTRRANIKYLEEFPALQDSLQYKILNEIEYELSILKAHISQLHQVNQDTKNKLSSLERLTVDLNWEYNSELIRGSALQPPLARILQEGLSFWLYFAEIMKFINEGSKNLDIRDRKSVTALENSFKVDLNNKVVNGLLAITQYVNNDKSLV